MRILFLVFLSALLSSLKSQTKIYWTSRNDDHIASANIDGTGKRVLISNRFLIEDLALDLVNEKLYWIKWGGIFTSNLDGSDIDTIIRFYEHRVFNDGLALDVYNKRLYWSNRGNTDNKIVKSNMDGFVVKTIHKDYPYDIRNPISLAIDFKHQKLYWADPAVQKIRRSNLDGSQLETILEGSYFYDLALDLKNDKILYVHDRGNDIFQADLDGTNQEVLYYSDLEKFYQIAINVELHELYWTTQSGKIFRANRDGTNAHQILSGLGNGNLINDLKVGVLDTFNQPKIYEIQPFNIFPNPTERNLYIEGIEKRGFVNVYDSSAKLMAKFEVFPAFGEITELDISNLTNGLYFVQYTDLDGNKSVQKIIKQ